MKRTTVFLATACLAILGMAGIASAQDSQVAGTWTLASPGRSGEMTTQTLTLQQDGQKLTGTLKGDRGETPLTGTISGNNITLTVTRKGQSGDMKTEYTGTVTSDNNTLNGTVTMGGSSVAWAAQRAGTKPPVQGRGGEE